MNFLQVWENILSPLVPVVTFLIVSIASISALLSAF